MTQLSNLQRHVLAAFGCILLALYALLNGYLLTWLYVIGYVISHIGEKLSYYQHLSNASPYCFGYGTIVVFTVIGLIYPFDILLTAVLLKVRQATNSEKALLQPLLDTVLVKAHGVVKGAPLTKVHFMVSVRKEMALQAFGRNIIIVTRGLLNNATTEELTALLAHAVDQLRARDGGMLAGLVFAGIVTRLIMVLYTLVLKFSRYISRTLGKVEGLFNLPGYIVLLVCSPLLLANYLCSYLFQFTVKCIFRRCVYRADLLVVELGYTDGLLSYLAKVDLIDTPTDSTILGQLIANMPPAAMRIDKITTNNY